MDFNRHWRKTIVASALTLILTGCGGSSDSDKSEEITPPETTPPPATTAPPETTTPPAATEYDHQVSGLAVYQGALVGANVCVDLNQNLSCDSGEPTSTTDTDGNYQIDWTSEVETPNYYLLANWTAASSATALANVDPLAITEQQPPLAINTVVNSQGEGQLLATSEHNGAINSATHTELTRILAMIKAQLSQQEVSTLTRELKSLLATLYQQDVDTVFNIDAATSISERILVVEAFLPYIERLISGQVTDILVNEKVLANTIEAVTTLWRNSNLSLDEFISLDSDAARTNINNSLIALGYVEAPIDSSLLSQADWAVIFNNIINESGFVNTFVVTPVINDDFVFTLLHEDTHKNLIGVYGNGVLFRFNPDTDEDGQATECWNSTTQTWLSASEVPDNYTPPEPYVEGNNYHTYYEGTEVALTINFEKLLTEDTKWQTLLAASPSLLNLDDVEWPSAVYKMQMSLQADVMCRNQDGGESYELPESSSPQQLTTTNIAETFFESDYPDYTLIDEDEQTIAIHDGAGNISEEYQWTKSEAPNGADLISLEQKTVVSEQEMYTFTSHYLLDSNTLNEVEIMSATPENVTDSGLSITFENSSSFTDRLLQHLTDL
ncbi:hypothetical protein Q4557_13685 [Shewanella sp. 5_MG-2023]|uniref:hypothetical protein n=1 Tax=Shewanella sp. 5_MG-2023 TaxID=3062656 RepID=UPI0026E2736B|nr:hypothetical protein [Shewanella sp. 5_MG-2023]MDO6641008.1 hypothetical protein [Shewanella sp. 5_MG-2023]